MLVAFQGFNAPLGGKKTRDNLIFNAGSAHGLWFPLLNFPQKIKLC